MKKLLTIFSVLAMLFTFAGAAAADDGYVSTPNISVTTTTGSATFTLKSDTKGAYIYYTINGQDPTTSSKKYTSSVKVTSTCEVRAVAYDNSAKEYSPVGYYLVTVTKARAAAPEFKATAVNGGKKVTITSTSGATIYYTLDGSTPTTSSKKYTSSGITVTEDTVIKAVATKSGYDPSKIEIAEVYIPTLAAPTAKATTSGSSRKITLSATSGATIYYTTNGSTPTTSSKKYSSPFTVSGTTNIRAIAVKPGYKNSPVYSTTVEAARLEAPQGSKTAIEGGYNVKLTAESGASIYYTLDGSTPTTSSKKYTTSGIKITTKGTTEINAIAYKSGLTTSSVATYNITVNQLQAPQASASSTTSGVKVTLSGPSGATIYYTTNGSTPTTSSKKYTGAFTVTSACTIKAIAVRNGYANSPVYSGTIKGAACAAPTGTKTAIAGGYNIKLTSATSGASIYYTLDGSTPTTSSKKYTSSGINVTTKGTTQINAISYKSGMGESKVAEFDITVSQLAAPSGSAKSSSTGATVTLTGPSGATIYYTTNGTNPTTSSKKYTSSFSVTTTTNIRAIAVKNGYANSAVYSGTVNFEKRVETPTGSQKKYTDYTLVTLKCATSSAKIYYTTDGSNPLVYGKSISSGSSIKIYESCQLKVAATRSGYADSAIATFTINVNGDNVTILGDDIYGDTEGELVNETPGVDLMVTNSVATGGSDGSEDEQDGALLDRSTSGEDLVVEAFSVDFGFNFDEI